MYLPLPKDVGTGAMPTLAVGMESVLRVFNIPTASVGMAPNFLATEAILGCRIN